MEATAPALRKNMEQRLEDAVGTAMRRVARMDVRRVAVEDQKRHIGRMTTTQLAITGSGFIGSLILMMPADAGPGLVARVNTRPEAGRPKGPELAEAIGTVGAAIALAFARSFTDEERLVVGMPIVITGGDVAVTFPWGRDFEARQCFSSGESPFWVILRLSRLDG
ncbi:MAG: hypothetical protein H6807_02255 [Planctomycetes bacterium]|nr:hypothetical protein [Planctomycetota bacterium]